MEQIPKHKMFNRYFWFANVFLWMAIHAVFTHIQYSIGLDSEREQTWLWTWVGLSPWFVNWIWMTAAVFLVTKHNEDPNRPRWIKIVNHLLSMVVLLVAYWSLSIFMQEFLINDGGDYFHSWQRIVSSSSQLDVLIYGAVLAAALGARFYHKLVEERLALKQLQSALSQEQLKTLRSQLNPHFLFNALNTVASLVRLKREKEAVSSLSELSHMLRKILENKNNSDIKVKDEIAFINSYLAIQKMRFADKLDARISVDEDCLDVDIPNMLLHPLVENAVHHGSQLESNKNLLNLEIKRTESELNIKLTNKVAVDDKHDGFGIGLSNTRARLNRLYSNFQLELHPLNDDLFETLLAIPIGDQQDV